MNSNDKADAAWDDYIDQQQQEKIEELERELNAANAKIKRLEEAGDALSETQTYDLIQNINWRRAKEFKP